MEDNLSKDQEPTEEIIEMEDEDGNVIRMRVLDRLSLKDTDYIVVHDEEDEDEEGVMIFRLGEDEEGYETFEPIDDEDELDEVFYLF